MSVLENFVFICAGCGYKARLPEQFAGRTIKCPGCQQPQVTVVQTATKRKTATISRVATTPMPFSLPIDDAATLSRASLGQEGQGTQIGKAFPSPLPGAVQVITDRLTRQATLAPANDQPPTAKPAFGATIDFGCTACGARLRLPAHYADKTILCPKCNAPQKVIPPLAPMDTTRTLSQTVGAAGDSIQPLIARVRVTPLPQSYPTPKPTNDSALVPAVPPLATPAKSLPAGEESLLEALAAATADEPVPTAQHAKPHPSRTKTNVAGMTMERPVVAPIPPPPAPKTHRLVVAIGLLSVLAVILAAGLMYAVLALAQSHQQLAQAEQATRDAIAREAATSSKLATSTQHVAELEGRLATAVKPPNEPAPVPEAPVATVELPATLPEVVSAAQTPAALAPAALAPAAVIPTAPAPAIRAPAATP